MLDKYSKRIAFLCTGLVHDGAETQLTQLAMLLSKRGWDVGVISMLPPRAFVDELMAAGIFVASLDMRRKRPDPRVLFKFSAILRQWQPVLLHSHMVHANLLARLSRPIHGVPVLVSTAHNINEGPRWREIAYRLTDSLCDITTNVSRAAVERYIRVGAVPKGRIKFIPNGVDTRKFTPNPAARAAQRQALNVSGSFVWLAVGRFEQAKDHLTMIRALVTVTSSYKNTRLLLVGQGDLEPAIKDEVAALELGDNVSFLGIRHDIPDLMNAADAYLLSSAWEGLPMVLLEAAASGLPIVATEVGGNAEIVLDGRTGFTVPAKQPAALAAAMMRMMELPWTKRQEMGHAGRAHIIANYDMAQIVDQWEILYSGLLFNLQRPQPFSNSQI